LRGDSAFSLTANFDDWNRRGVDFVFGMDCHPCLVTIANALPEQEWQPLARLAKYEVATEPREKREREKERIVKERGYLNKRLTCEHVAEFNYQPLKCEGEYRVIVLRKNLSVERGELALFDEIVYFFYITNRTDLTAEQVVRFSNERGDQENVISQLKSGVHAMRMPVDNLLSNWAYMVMVSLAWSLKAWMGMLMPDQEQGDLVQKMEFRRFLQRYMMVPCQVVRTGRRIVYRILGYNPWLVHLLALADRLQSLPGAT
jgi:hypothetical protein